MKDWKIWYSVQIDGEVEEKSLTVEAATIRDALDAAEAAVSERFPHADKTVIWDVGIMNEDVF